MDIDQIEAFLAIVETGGFTRAASRLHRSQPAISRRVHLLEAELGAPLLERLPGGVRLTEVGRVFLPHAEAVLAALRDGDEAIRDELREGAGGASLAVVGTLVDRSLAAALREFSARLQGAPLKVLTTTSDGVSNLVRRGEVAIGVRYFPDENPELACRAIGHEAMIVVGAADRTRRSRGSRTVARLASERWVGFPARTSKEDFGRLLRVRLAAAGLAHAEIMDVDSLSAQKRLVEAGFGVALVPKSGVGEELASGTLEVVRAPKIATSLPVVLVQRRHGYLSPAAHALSDRLASVWAATAGARSSARRRPARSAPGGR